MACISGIPTSLSLLTHYSTSPVTSLSLISSNRHSSQGHTLHIGSHSSMQSPMTFCQRFTIISCISTMLHAFARNSTLLVVSLLLLNFKHGSHIGLTCIYSWIFY